MLSDPLFWLVAIPAILIFGISKGGFGGSIAVVSVPMLTLVISIDNLSAGIATAAFITYMSSLTNVAFSATQYALFSSIMLLFPKFLAGFSGLYVDTFGYNIFFLSTALIGIPVLLLIFTVSKNSKSSSETQSESN